MIIDDVLLERAQQPLCASVWTPDQPLVVLGRSNDKAEVHSDWCSEQRVSVTQRYGGGGTVVLYPGCIVVSVGAWMQHRFQNEDYFRKINQAVLDIIAEQQPDLAPYLDQRGISDLTVADKKFGGTSLFRSKRYLVYQASLIVDADFDLIRRALPMPSRMPSYRLERSHEDFLVGLAEAGARTTKARGRAPSIFRLVSRFRAQLLPSLNNHLRPDFGSVDSEHLRHLRSRMQRRDDWPLPEAEIMRVRAAMEAGLLTQEIRK